MSITRPCYCSREAIKRALDIKETARADWQIDRAIETASDQIDGGADGANRGAGLLRRRFYPEDDTRYFDWPDGQGTRPWRVWLNQHDLISATQIVSGGVTLSDYFLRPDDGPPFTHIEVDLGSQS
ncbi:MAG TPA: hypothetical protein VGF55_29175, partial [Gemmataceae bacterium]